MAAKLAANVVLRHPETGAPAVLLVGSDLPDWAKGSVGDHALEGGEPASTGSDEPPAKAGAGSSRAKWADYAAARGVRVADDDTRDDIIAACEAAGVRTE